MKVIKSPLAMQKELLKLKLKGKTIGLVPTMGALHDGHLSLVKRARKENKVVVVSIFVNPTQFGPNEDYLKYPRPFKNDAAMCKKSGVDYIFAPEPKDMYSDDYKTYVTVDKMSEVMCGKFRPGHFRGVASVVAKLFNICQPDNAYFGVKDFQQLKIIERMTKDLNFPVKIKPCPILREKTGLALSSRNQYLNPVEHQESLVISQSLVWAKDMILKGKQRDSSIILKELTRRILSVMGARIDYIAISNPETLAPMKVIKLPALINCAVWIGKTRLIDNIVVKE